MSPYYAKPGQFSMRQMGFRYPKFLGGRKTSANQIACLAAIPVFAGESLRQLELVGVINTDNDENPDKILQHEWLVTYHPFQWADPTDGRNLDAGTVDGFVELTFNDTINQHQWGARPNPGGDNDWMGSVEAGIGGDEVIYQYPQFLTPNASGIDTGLITPDQTVVRMGASHRKTIRKNHYFGADGLVCVSSARSDIVAQTDFGVAEMDGTSATEDQVLGALTTAALGDVISATAQADKLHELIYGGDQYIEADTLSSVATRAGLMVQTIIATPWPRLGT